MQKNINAIGVGWKIHDAI